MALKKYGMIAASLASANTGETAKTPWRDSAFASNKADLEGIVDNKYSHKQ